MTPTKPKARPSLAAAGLKSRNISTPKAQRPSLPIDLSKATSPSKTNFTPRKSVPFIRSPLKERPITNGNLNISEDGKESAIKVYVRCRGRNEREINENSSVVVSTAAEGITRGKDISVQSGAGSSIYKTYSFDHVFGPEADQEMVYDGIARNVLKEMVEGYNCTIFAYGQTGTGKTHTMSGTFSSKATGKGPTEGCGVIPRTLHHLFEMLESAPSIKGASKTAGREHSVKLSFIELYNEELRDLLAPEEEEFSRKVRIFEESANKGVTIHGMEEIYIRSAKEGLKVLEDGSFRRQVATTRYNDRSSRSHSVFTITLHIKEVSINGEEYVRTGKLNLVDLAGSENISRSGAENKRAREAGMINQSLLTLGRVINSLVERSPHIPYRESKLTRVLQDSLGGQTKTCIIATISPAKVSLDETLSTLEYASRAKSIRNKPRVNQTTSKQALIKDYVAEIERMRGDLLASRQKNGVYMTEESLQTMTEESESRRLLIEEQKLRLEVVDAQLKKGKLDAVKNEEKLASMEEKLEQVSTELTTKNVELTEVKEKLDIALLELQKSQEALKDEVCVRKAHEETEAVLSIYCEELSKVSRGAISDVELLHTIVCEAVEGEKKSQYTLKCAKEKLQENLSALQEESQKLESSSLRDLSLISGQVGEFVATNYGQLINLTQLINKSHTDLNSGPIKELSRGIEQTFTGMQVFLSNLQSTREEIVLNMKEGFHVLETQTSVATNEVCTQLEQVDKSLEGTLSELDRQSLSVFSKIKDQVETQLKGISENIERVFVPAMDMTESEVKLLDQELGKLVTQEIERAASAKTQLLEQLEQSVCKNHEAQVASLESIKLELKKLGGVGKGIQKLRGDHVKSMQDWKQNFQQANGDILETSRLDFMHTVNSTQMSEREKLNVVRYQLKKGLDENISRIITNQVQNLDSKTSILNTVMNQAQDLNNERFSECKEGVANVVQGLRELVQDPLQQSIKEIQNLNQKNENEVDEEMKIKDARQGLGKTAQVLKTQVKSSRKLVELDLNVERTSFKSLKHEEGGKIHVHGKRVRGCREYEEEMKKLGSPKRTRCREEILLASQD